MKRFLCSVCLMLALLLTACGGPAATGVEGASLTIVASTYPVYLFACAVTEGVEGVAVARLNTGQASCLHDYTLSVDDMKLLEGADVIALNGAGLEDFMVDALAASSAEVIDCSQGVALLEHLEHRHEEGDEDHDHGHWDPHIWMDPANAEEMVVNLQNGLAQADPDHAEEYHTNARGAVTLLSAWDSNVRDLLDEEEGPEIAGLVTFHDGFQYFAKAYDLPLLASIEEEEGSEASAKEILEMVDLVREYRLPVIFTEVNGSDATAKAIARETGCRVSQLTMMMDGPDGDLANYLDGMLGNAAAIVNGFAGREVVTLG